MTERKRKADRACPPRPLLERIDAPHEAITRASLSLPQSYEWQYLKDADAEDRADAYRA